MATRPVGAGFKRGVTRGGHQMGFIHRDQAEPFLKQSDRLARPRNDEAGVSAMRGDLRSFDDIRRRRRRTLHQMVDFWRSLFV